MFIFKCFLLLCFLEFRVGELKWFGTLQISQNKKILTVTTKHEKIAKMKVFFINCVDF